MDVPTVSSIGPDIWGRSFWEFLDAIVATYPRDDPSPEHRKAVLELMQSLQFLLPCPICRKHYSTYLQKNSLEDALQSRYSLLVFYFHLKQEIANRSNKLLPFKTPDELWVTIKRRLKLTTRNVQPRQMISKQVFRVPGRLKNNNTTTPVVKKGCGCGKRS